MSPPSVLAAPAASTLPAQDTVPFSPAAGTVAPPSPLPAAAAGSGVGGGGVLRACFLLQVTHTHLLRFVRPTRLSCTSAVFL
jgi:hypothetical protein